MVRTWVKLALADLLLLAAALFVLQDSQMRSSCTLAGCTALQRTSSAFAYSVLTKSFSMTVNGNVLSSPPALDWLQVVVVLFVLVNAWYGYRAVFGKNIPGTPPVSG